MATGATTFPMEQFSVKKAQIASPPRGFSILDTVFPTGFNKQRVSARELMGLEIALTSDCIRKELPEADFFASPDANTRLSSPMLTHNAYADMKIPFLGENERSILLEKYLTVIGKECAGVGYKEEHRLAVDVLRKKLGTTRQTVVESPVMNFKFDKDGERMDFSDAPFVREFLSFKKDAEKRKWLQKCLRTGIFVYSNIPLEKLGFKLTNILFDEIAPVR